MSVVYVNPPKVCDTCKTPFGAVLYDAKLAIGPWANVCEVCFGLYNCKIGLGHGQKYELQGDKYVKVEG